ncbi:MAG: ABC transporter ATP-binding protein [Clostridia bacterium]
MKNIVLKAENIKKTFKTGEVETEVLKGVNLEICEGEFIAIVGESGSGKSTMLYILAGIDKPTEGKVELLGRDISKISDNELAELRRRDFSFVYQFDNLVPNLTAYENIVLPLVLDRKKESEFKEHVAEIAKYLGIDERLKSFPKALSGGEQQRVAIARALATSPKIIFLDEPTGSLDKERGRQVMELLADINNTQGVALAMVTHSVAHSKYASRIVTMEDGKLKSDEAQR